MKQQLNVLGPHPGHIKSNDPKNSAKSSEQMLFGGKQNNGGSSSFFSYEFKRKDEQSPEDSIEPLKILSPPAISN